MQQDKMTNYMVSQDITLSKLWMIDKRSSDDAGRPWDTDCGLGFHRTARAARSALEARQGGKLTAWTKHNLGGRAVYTAQDYTGPIVGGLQKKP